MILDEMFFSSKVKPAFMRHAVCIHIYLRENGNFFKKKKKRFRNHKHQSCSRLLERSICLIFPTKVLVCISSVRCCLAVFWKAYINSQKRPGNATFSIVQEVFDHYETLENNSESKSIELVAAFQFVIDSLLISQSPFCWMLPFSSFRLHLDTCP